ncbi:MAG: 3-isopropylmalate dehydratase small subunit [Myxococcota bacterium]
MSAIRAERVSARRGRGVVVRGNDIDTDQIIPARYMTSIRFAGLEEFVFRDVRFNADGEPKGHPFDDRRFRGASILVVNQNFGCGSSREHAPQALQRWGIQALVAESFAEIFFGNCVALGILAVTAARDDVARLMDAIELDPGQEVTIDLDKQVVAWRGGSAPVKMPDGARKQLLDGSWDAMRTLLEARDATLVRIASLPYATGF